MIKSEECRRKADMADKRLVAMGEWAAASARKSLAAPARALVGWRSKSDARASEFSARRARLDEALSEAFKADDAAALTALVQRYGSSVETAKGDLIDVALAREALRCADAAQAAGFKMSPAALLAAAKGGLRPPHINVRAIA